MNTGPYKEGVNSSEFYQGMTGGLSPVIVSALVALLTKIGVPLSDATQMVLFIGSFVVALPSIVYYIKKRTDFKTKIIENPQPVSQEFNMKLLELLLQKGDTELIKQLMGVKNG